MSTKCLSFGFLFVFFLVLADTVVVVGAVAAVAVAVAAVAVAVAIVAAVGGNEVIKVNALSRRLPEILVAVVFRGLCFTGIEG